MNAAYLKEKFEQGLTYADYLATGTPDQKAGWEKIDGQVALSEAHRRMLGACTREMKVLVVSGIWCGDCVRQGPMIQQVADAIGKAGDTAGGGGGTSGGCEVRWLDRDEHMDLQEQVAINAGNRVPVAIFLAEDFEPVGWAGDKLLSRYRVMAQQQLGAHCPLPGAPVPQDELDAELADWVAEFERVHLLLRLSGRLRKKHQD